MARQAATSSLSGLMLPARIVGSRRVSNRALVGGGGNVSCMVVAVSSWPRRSSSAHRICIRPQCPCGAAAEATLHTQAGPCSWAAVATQCGPRATPRRVVSQLYAQCRGRLRGDTATRFDLNTSGRRDGRGLQSAARATEKCGAQFGWRRGTEKTKARNMSNISPLDLATHQGGPQHKGSPRPRLLSLRRRGEESSTHHCLRDCGGEGKQRVRQTGATAYLLICGTGVPVPLLEVCDVSVIRFARRQADEGLNATGQPSTSVRVGGNGTERKARQTGSFSFHLGQGSSATAVYIQPGFRSFALPATSPRRPSAAASHTVRGGVADLATHQGGPQHKGSPRPRLLSLRRRGEERRWGREATGSSDWGDSVSSHLRHGRTRATARSL